MNDLTIGISSIGIQADTVSTACLYVLYSRLFPPRSTSNFYRHFKKKIFYTCPSIGKCRKCFESNPVRVFLTQFHSKKAMSQVPCLDIEYAKSYGPFLATKSKVEQKTKYLHRIAATFLISNRIIFRFDGFQPYHPPFIPTIHIILYIL